MHIRLTTFQISFLVFYVYQLILGTLRQIDYYYLISYWDRDIKFKIALGHKVSNVQDGDSNSVWLQSLCS